jgi:hypothetical protein
LKTIPLRFALKRKFKKSEFRIQNSGVAEWAVTCGSVVRDISASTR